MNMEEGHSAEELYSDDELVERIILGDENAAEILIKRYSVQIHSISLGNIFGHHIY